MARPYDIIISNGTGSASIVNGTYAVTAVAAGYENISIDPSSVNITADIDTYPFTISATGTLTLHVTDTGTPIGLPVSPAAFHRCDSTGTKYGEEIVADAYGNAEFPFVPFAASDAPTIYYKQVRSDGEHNFDDTLQNTTMTDASKTLEIINALPAPKTIILTDHNYSGLPIVAATVTHS